MPTTREAAHRDPGKSRHSEADGIRQLPRRDRRWPQSVRHDLRRSKTERRTITVTPAALARARVKAAESVGRSAGPPWPPTSRHRHVERRRARATRIGRRATGWCCPRSPARSRRKLPEALAHDAARSRSPPSTLPSRESSERRPARGKADGAVPALPVGRHRSAARPSSTKARSIRSHAKPRKPWRATPRSSTGASPRRRRAGRPTGWGRSSATSCGSASYELDGDGGPAGGGDRRGGQSGKALRLRRGGTARERHSRARSCGSRSRERRRLTRREPRSCSRGSRRARASSNG